MRALIFSFFFSTSIFARQMVVEDGHLKYKLAFDDNKLVYQNEVMDISLQKKECNRHIIERMNKKLNHFLEQPFLDDTRPGFLKITLDKKVGYEPRFGDRAIFLIQINQEIKKLKIEESFNCKTN